jgi:hypothetical protein
MNRSCLAALERFHGDAAIRERLVAHCRARMEPLERTLGEPREALQRAFEAELARGLAWQQARIAYEDARLAAGAKQEDPAFFAAFDAEHGPIASEALGHLDLLAR